jgi:hypothetical protein
MDMGPRKEIMFILWAIFLDAHEVFSQQIKDTNDPQHNPGNVLIGHAGPACDEIKLT